MCEEDEFAAVVDPGPPPEDVGEQLLVGGLNVHRACVGECVERVDQGVDGVAGLVGGDPHARLAGFVVVGRHGFVLRRSFCHVVLSGPSRSGVGVEVIGWLSMWLEPTVWTTRWA